MTGITGTETLLVVEDELDLLRMIQLGLRRAGYTVLEAGSPTAALQLLADYHGPLHLVLTDIIMPGMNGRDLYQEIVRQFPSAGVLFMSGYPVDFFPETAEDEIQFAFLRKPFELHQLAVRVRLVLDARGDR